MSQQELTSLRKDHFIEFVSAQIEKINLALLQQKKDYQIVSIIEQAVHKHTAKIQEACNKLQLIEVFQKQNFQNSERLFSSYQKIQHLDSRLTKLEGGDLCISSRYPFQNDKQTSYPKEQQNTSERQDEMIHFQMRLREVEMEIYKNKEKVLVLNKFLRQISPRGVNSESTKDISIEHHIDKKELKKIENRLQEFILYKFSTLQKNYSNKERKQSKMKTQIQSQYWQEQSPYLPIRKTRVKQINKQYKQSIEKQEERQRNESGQTEMKKKLENYYTETIEPQQYLSIKNRIKVQSLSLQMKFGKQKKKNKKSVSKSKSKKGVSLSSVNEYLKIKRTV